MTKVSVSQQDEGNVRQVITSDEKAVFLLNKAVNLLEIIANLLMTSQSDVITDEELEKDNLE